MRSIYCQYFILYIYSSVHRYKKRHFHVLTFAYKVQTIDGLIQEWILISLITTNAVPKS